MRQFAGTMALPDVETVNGDDGAGESDVMSSASLLAAFTESAEIRALISSLVEVQEDCAAQESTIQRFVGENLLHLLHLLYHLVLILNVCSGSIVRTT